LLFLDAIHRAVAALAGGRVVRKTRAHGHVCAYAIVNMAMMTMWAMLRPSGSVSHLSGLSAEAANNIIFYTKTSPANMLGVLDMQAGAREWHFGSDRISIWMPACELSGEAVWFTMFDDMLVNPNGAVVRLIPSSNQVKYFDGPFPAARGLWLDTKATPWICSTVSGNQYAQPRVAHIFDTTGGQVEYWDLPLECQQPMTIWGDDAGPNIWIASFSASYTGASTGALLARLHVPTDVLTIWTDPFSTLADSRGVWGGSSTGHSVWVSDATNVFRFNPSASRVNPANIEHFHAPGASFGSVCVTPTGDAWVVDQQTIRMFDGTRSFHQATVQAGVVQLVRNTGAVRMTPSTTTPTTFRTGMRQANATLPSTFGGALQLPSGATPVTVRPSLATGGDRRVFWTDPGLNSIWRLDY
jgi:hypothetical protein